MLGSCAQPPLSSILRSVIAPLGSRDDPIAPIIKDDTLALLPYAIGDVHGCLDELRRLLASIEDDAKTRPYKLVFVGDYIDKGPDSAGVIETVMRMQANASPQVICLKGNH